MLRHSRHQNCPTDSFPLFFLSFSFPAYLLSFLSSTFQFPSFSTSQLLSSAPCFLFSLELSTAYVHWNLSMPFLNLPTSTCSYVPAHGCTFQAPVLNTAWTKGPPTLFFTRIQSCQLSPHRTEVKNAVIYIHVCP